MSGTQEHAGAQPAEEYVPTNVLSSEDEPGAQPQPKPEGDPPREGEQPKPGEGEEPKPDPETEARKERANEARRIAALVRQRTEERVARQDAERRIAELTERLQRLENPGQAQQPDIERLVAERLEQRTTEVLAQREEQARVQTFHGAGAEAFPDWQSRCTDLMEMGADPGLRRSSWTWERTAPRWPGIWWTTRPRCSASPKCPPSGSVPLHWGNMLPN
jgi:hypothetical protein